MTHHRFASLIPALVAIACGGGDGGRTSFTEPNKPPTGATQLPKSSDQLPVISDQLPGTSSGPAGPAPGTESTCERLCNRALGAECQMSGTGDCHAECQELDAQPCVAELLSVLDCALSAGLCPNDNDDNDALLVQSCSPQLLVYSRCRGPIDEDE